MDHGSLRDMEEQRQSMLRQVMQAPAKERCKQMLNHVLQPFFVVSLTMMKCFALLLLQVQNTGSPRKHCSLTDINDFLSVARIALVKPEKAKQVENMILMEARSGRLAEKVSPSLL